jgi:hypothetical protein
MDDELKDHTESSRKRAMKAEAAWRASRGLSKSLQHKGNVTAARRRKRAECPKESKASAKRRRWREKLLGKMGAASKVRRIDVEDGG